MSYILAVNPSILSVTGMDKGALFTATVVSTVLTTLIMAFWAKLPLALAPAMGMNAFFAFTVCLGMGYKWDFALTAVLIEGVLFVILTLTNMRNIILNVFPDSLKKAIAIGIGLFVSFIGLQNAGIIVKNDATLISLGNITSGAPLLALIGLVITSVMVVRKITGAMLWGIIITTLIGIPMGITHFGGIAGMPPSVEPTFMKFDFSHVLSTDMAMAVFTLLFMDIFDTLGTLMGVCTNAHMMVDGKIPKAKEAFATDAIGTVIGAILGTSTVSTFVESASGVAVGGRSGVTSFTVAVCFILAIFFAPLFLSIPNAATAPVLILVGLFMFTSVKEIDMTDFSESIPSYICILTIPMAYSISDGIIFGMISYVLINILFGNFRKLTTSMYVIAALLPLKYII
jgi:AGZA family xanthine/uracil permease-like MFS transporter